MLGILAELHPLEDLKLTIKFEVEVLCKNLNKVMPASILAVRSLCLQLSFGGSCTPPLPLSCAYAIATVLSDEYAVTPVSVYRGASPRIPFCVRLNLVSSVFQDIQNKLSVRTCLNVLNDDTEFTQAEIVFITSHTMHIAPQ